MNFLTEFAVYFAQLIQHFIRSDWLRVSLA